MIYSDIEQIQKDFEYLTSRCSLEYFSQARPSLAKIEEYFLKIQRYDDKFILNYFEDLIKEFNIEISSWKKTINYHKLPLLVIIPEKGIRIILEKMPDGTFKSEGKDGIEYFEEFKTISIQCSKCHRCVLLRFSLSDVIIFSSDEY